MLIVLWIIHHHWFEVYPAGWLSLSILNARWITWAEQLSTHVWVSDGLKSLTLHDLGLCNKSYPPCSSSLILTLVHWQEDRNVDTAVESKDKSMVLCMRHTVVRNVANLAEPLHQTNPGFSSFWDSFTKPYTCPCMNSIRLAGNRLFPTPSTVTVVQGVLQRKVNARKTGHWTGVIEPSGIDLLAPLCRWAWVEKTVRWLLHLVSNLLYCEDITRAKHQSDFPYAGYFFCGCLVLPSLGHLGHLLMATTWLRR